MTEIKFWSSSSILLLSILNCPCGVMGSRCIFTVHPGKVVSLGLFSREKCLTFSLYKPPSLVQGPSQKIPSYKGCFLSTFLCSLVFFRLGSCFVKQRGETQSQTISEKVLSLETHLVLLICS